MTKGGDKKNRKAELNFFLKDTLKYFLNLKFGF